MAAAMAELLGHGGTTAHLAKDLVHQGFCISDDTVGRLLKRLGYSQSPAKQKEGIAHGPGHPLWRRRHGQRRGLGVGR